jgi:hypothetical protein
MFRFLSSVLINLAGMPNWSFNSDANTGHGFAIFMAFVGALRTCGAPVPLTWVLGFRPSNSSLQMTSQASHSFQRNRLHQQ